WLAPLHSPRVGAGHPDRAALRLRPQPASRRPLPEPAAPEVAPGPCGQPIPRPQSLRESPTRALPRVALPDGGPAERRTDQADQRAAARDDAGAGELLRLGLAAH